MACEAFGDRLPDHQRLDILYTLATVHAGSGVHCFKAATEDPEIET